MSKFILVENPSDFKKIEAYVKEKVMTQFYFTRKLMYTFIHGFSANCVLGLNISAIKLNARQNVDLLCNPVYNKVFQNDVFRVEAIKINGVLCQLASNFENEDIIFGMDEDYEEYHCSDLQKL